MTGSSTDVAEQLADHWNAHHTDQATATDFWPCCRILHEHGLLEAQDENLAAVSLGPFHLAVQRSHTPTRDFLDVLLPSVAASLPAEDSVTRAVSGALAAACTCFVKLLGSGVVFGRGDLDRLRWEVLAFIRSRNTDGIRPTRQDVTTAFATGPDDPGPERVGAAIEWLACEDTVPPPDRPRIPLVAELRGGGLTCLV